MIKINTSDQAGDGGMNWAAYFFSGMSFAGWDNFVLGG